MCIMSEATCMCWWFLCTHSLYCALQVGCLQCLASQLTTGMSKIIGRYSLVFNKVRLYRREASSFIYRVPAAYSC